MANTNVTAADMLIVLRQFFADRTVKEDEHQKLWAVLSALRGPDNDDFTLKYATTALIRHAAFGYNLGSCGAVVSEYDNEEEVKRRTDGATQLEQWHFIAHAQHAFKVLGLSWSTSNGERQQAEKREGP